MNVISVISEKKVPFCSMLAACNLIERTLFSPFSHKSSAWFERVELLQLFSVLSQKPSEVVMQIKLEHFSFVNRNPIWCSDKLQFSKFHSHLVHQFPIRNFPLKMHFSSLTKVSAWKIIKIFSNYKFTLTWPTFSKFTWVRQNNKANFHAEEFSDFSRLACRL